MPHRLAALAHPDRAQLSEELHARPSQPLGIGARVSRILMAISEGEGAQVDAHLAALCRNAGAPAPAADARWHEFKHGGMTVRFERHTEFASFAFSERIGDGEAPFVATALARTPDDWLLATPGKLLAATHLEVRTAQGHEALLGQAFARGGYAMGRMAASGAIAASDFRLHEDGCGRILVLAGTDDAEALGRLAQALLEVDAYRLAALLAFPAAAAARAELGAIEADLAAAMTDLAAGAAAAQDRALLASITQLAARAERLIAATAYRFAAGRAYYRLVEERLKWLGETPGGSGRPTFSAFLKRRLAPAMRTCDATAQRQEALAARIDRATRLLATRVQVTSEEQSAALLKSMDARAKLQLRLQQTVEGLSVFAISYYALGLLGYVFKALEETLHIKAALAVGIAAPIVVGLVWVGLKRAHQHLAGRAGTATKVD